MPVMPGRAKSKGTAKKKTSKAKDLEAKVVVEEEREADLVLKRQKEARQALRKPEAQA